MSELDEMKTFDASTLDLSHQDLVGLRDNQISKAIDHGLAKIGELASWLWLILLVVIIGNVILRYVFRQGMIELEELQWYLYAAAWLVGLSYTFIHDGHVRVDVVNERMTPKARLWFELMGLLVFFMPFVLFVLYFSIPFVELSWVTNERSTSANGLPARWLIKGCLLFSFLLLFAAGLARVLRLLDTLKNGMNASVESSIDDK